MKNSYIRIKKTSLFSYKKVLIALLYLCSICILCGFLTTEIQEEIQWQNTWQAHATYDFEEIIEINEDGEEEIVYGISTPEQLAGMFCKQENVSADDYSNINKNNKYMLFSNIDLGRRSWTPSNLSSGYTFDGNSFVITGMKIDYDGIPKTQYLGFIKENYGTIQNITFKDVFFDNGSTGMRKDVYVGAACCINHNIVQNISVVGSSTIQSSSYDNADREIGGIVGYNYGTIKFCTNYAAVAYGKHIGGICGRNAGTVQNCFNYGSVSSVDDVCVRVGGIVGETNANSVVELCANYGTITGNSTTNYDSAAGGIVGYSSAAISQCANNGTVYAGGSSTSSSYAGGIAGYSSSTISNCYNLKDISAITSSSTSTSTVSTGNKETRLVVSYFGDINMNIGASGGSSSSTYTYGYAGGIVGCGYGTCSYCYNLGKINGGKIIGSSSASYYSSTSGKGYDSSCTFNYSASYTSYYRMSGINGRKTTSCSSSCYSRYTYDYTYSYYYNYSSWHTADGGWNRYGGEIFYYDVYAYASMYPKITSSTLEIIGTLYNTKSSRGWDVVVWNRGSDTGSTFYPIYDIITAYIDKASKYYSPGLSQLSSGYWTSKSTINNGYPYLKNLYW